MTSDRSRRARRATAIVLAWVLGWAQVAAAQSPTLEQALQSARAHFDAGRHWEAGDAFVRAAELADGEADRRVILHNAAVSYSEAGEFARAEATFVGIARAGGPDAQLALLHAGLHALRDDRPDDAHAHLGSADAQPAAGTDDAEMAAETREARTTLQGKLADHHLQAGLDALDGGDATAAIAALRRGEPYAQGDDGRRATLAWALAEAHLSADDPQAALSHIDRALALDDDDPDKWMARGRVRRALGDRRGARQDYRRAGEVATDPDARQRALSVLLPLPPRGPTASLSVAGGYDSNTAQTGTLGQLTVGQDTRVPSGLIESRAGAGYVLRPHPHWAVVPRLAVDSVALTASGAQAQSLMSLQLWTDVSHAPDESSLWRLSAFTDLSLAGLGEFEPFTVSGGLDGGVMLTHSERYSVDLTVTLRASRGLDGSTELGGVWASVAARGGWLPAWGRVGVSAELQHNAIGALSLNPFEVRIDPCGGMRLCGIPPDMHMDLHYDVPLSYVSPVLGAELSWWATTALSLSMTPGYAHRRFTDSSGFRELGTTRKTRRDHRFTLDTLLAFTPFSPRYALELRHGYLVSRSNMRRGDPDPSHRFDHVDANFEQHVVTGGLRATW